MWKTATDQTFGGRRCALTMMALACVHNKDANGDIIGEVLHPVVCISVDALEGDSPMFRSLRFPDELIGPTIDFVQTEAELRPGTWTWKERV